MIIERIQTPLTGVVFDTSLRKESGVLEHERVTASDNPTDQKRKKAPYRGAFAQKGISTPGDQRVEDEVAAPGVPYTLDITA